MVNFMCQPGPVFWPKWSESCSVMSNSLWPHGIYSPWNSPGQNTEVRNLFLLPTQGLNPDLLHSRPILYQLSHQVSPSMLEWVAYPFSRVSSPPRNRIGVSCSASGFFYQLSYNRHSFSPKHQSRFCCKAVLGVKVKLSSTLQPHDLHSPRNSQTRILEWVAFPFFRGSSQSRDWTQVSHIAAEPPGKPKNTGVGSLSLLQQIFLTQESNRGLLHGRRILYQLSYEGSLT